LSLRPHPRPAPGSRAAAIGIRKRHSASTLRACPRRRLNI